MSTRLLQKFLIVFFVGAFLTILIIGSSRIKKQIGIVAVNGPGTNNSGTGSNAQNSSNLNTSAVSPSQNPNSQSLPKKTSSLIQTFTGTTYRIPWGDVTAEIQVQNGKIINISMPNVPDSSPSLYAQPILVDQALKAGSSNIQGVSGATYTSLAFQKSLESAIVQASSALNPGTSSTNTKSQTSSSGTQSTNLSSKNNSSNISSVSKTPKSFYGYDNDD